MLVDGRGVGVRKGRAGLLGEGAMFLWFWVGEAIVIRCRHQYLLRLTDRSKIGATLREYLRSWRDDEERRREQGELHG